MVSLSASPLAQVADMTAQRGLLHPAAEHECQLVDRMMRCAPGSGVVYSSALSIPYRLFVARRLLLANSATTAAATPATATAGFATKLAAPVFGAFGATESF